MIKYAEISTEENEVLYGPGRRIVIWVQGCSLKCKGCTSPQFWDYDKGKEITEEELIELCICDDLEGITFHGGEPMEQSDSLLYVAERILPKGKNVVCFTGYEVEELKRSSQIALASISDILITGRYEESKRNVYLQFRGSTNQKVLFPSGNFTDYKLLDGQNVSAIKISNDGDLVYNGFIDPNMVDLIKSIVGDN